MYVYDLKFMEGFEYVKVNQIARQSYLWMDFKRAHMYVKMVDDMLHMPYCCKAQQMKLTKKWFDGVCHGAPKYIISLYMRQR